MRGQLLRHSPGPRPDGRTAPPCPETRSAAGRRFGSNARHARHLRAADPRQPPVIRQLLRVTPNSLAMKGRPASAFESSRGCGWWATAAGSSLCRWRRWWPDGPPGPPLPPWWRRDRPLRCPARPSSDPRCSKAARSAGISATSVSGIGARPALYSGRRWWRQPWARSSSSNTATAWVG